jgi:hypothetical protein
MPKEDKQRYQRYLESIEQATETMRKNLAGFVTREYFIDTDSMDFVYGHLRWKSLIGSIPNNEHDPMALYPLSKDGKRDFTAQMQHREIPIEEFYSYLRDWYWPRLAAMGLGERPGY